MGVVSFKPAADALMVAVGQVLLNTEGVYGEIIYV